MDTGAKARKIFFQDEKASALKAEKKVRDRKEKKTFMTTYYVPVTEPGALCTLRNPKEDGERA